MKRGVLIVVLVGLALVACGRRGPLVAPERRLPAAVQDLAVA
ncbi:MAG: fibronectin type III domain-containing protein, partial [Candidatus Rokubacteria bacterium]|nr:fibronectin type III domain-containing protein [Candidatus Rokubacteria bacterium]